MSSISPGAALLVVDMQVGVVTDNWHVDDVTTRISHLVTVAREAGTPVVWVRHSSETMPVGSNQWQIVPELAPTTGEPIVEKRYGDAFEDTDLTEVLDGLGVTHLVVCGAQSDACVISTLFGGLVRGYNMTLVSDGHTTEDRTGYGGPTPDAVIWVINAIWAYRSAPGRVADTIAADAVTFN